MVLDECGPSAYTYGVHVGLNFLSVILAFAGVGVMGWVVYDHLLHVGALFRPLTLLGAMLVMSGVQLVSIGLIAEYVLALRFRLDNPSAYGRWMSAYT